MKLVIGNKNYSSWSMRPWLALKAAGIPFGEEIIWLSRADTAQRIASLSESGRVPVLVDGEMHIVESIAILEYLAERAPDLWPASIPARAHARSVSAEMHAGFAALRGRCSMNIRRKPSPIALGPEVQKDVARILAIWAGCRERFGTGGPFLFGRFTNADAMFGPVVSRFHTYAIPVPAGAHLYMDAVMATPMWQEWERAARAEDESIRETDAIA